MGDVMPSGGMPGGIPSWPACSMWYQVTNLLNTWGPPQDWGDAPETPNGLLQALQHVGDKCALGKKKDLRHIAAPVGGLMLAALQRVTETDRGRGTCGAFRRGSETRKEHVSPNDRQ